MVLLALLLSSAWLGICRADEENPSPVVQQMVEAVSEPTLSDTILHLQDDPHQPGLDAEGSRYSFSPGLALAADYIGDHLATAGLTVEVDTFVRRGTVMTNVVGTLAGVGPDDDLIYIICAHYDSIGNRTPGGWDPATDPAPGADDNGSGTAAVMEAARVLGEHRFAHTLRFIAFAGEEEGLWGSAHYAQEARAAGDSIGGVINLDMIGWDSDGDRAIELHAGTDPASEALAHRFTMALSTYRLDLAPQIFTIDAIGLSDHASFWAQGYPAFLGIEDTELRGPTADFNPYYHTIEDTFDKLDMAFVTAFTRATVATLAELAEPVTTDVAIAMEGPAMIRAGGVLTYTLSYSNVGSAVASDVVITDELPVGLSYQADDSGLPHAEWAPQVHRWEVGELPSGASHSFVVTTTVGADLAPGTTLTNTAEIGTASLEGRVEDNSSALMTVVAWELYLPFVARSGP